MRSCSTVKSHSIEIAERERGVVAKTQEIDNPLLGVLDLASGETSYYQGDAVFTFLGDWLPILATQILELRQPHSRDNRRQDVQKALRLSFI